MTTTEFRSQRDCEVAAKALTGSFVREKNGRAVTVETRAKCVPDEALDPEGFPARRGPFVPPVVTDIAPPYPGGTLPRPYDRPMPITPIEPHAGPEPWPQ